MENKALNRDSHPFHARIFRVYIEYLKDKCGWKEAQLQELLNECGVTMDRIQEDASWFDIEFADKFYEVVLRMTGDPKIAFNVGLYIKQNSFSAALYFMIRGLVNTGRLYQLVSKFTPHFTKAATMRVRKMGRTHAILESIPNPGQTERPYMCENRQGILTGIPSIFDMPKALIEEKECLHKGGTKCQYHVQWQERSNRWWFILMITATLTAGIVGFKFLDVYQDIVVTFGTFLITYALYMSKNYQFHKRELQSQNETLGEVVKGIERKNYELKLVGEISKLTHSLTTPEELSRTLVESVCKTLEYDRCILLIADRAHEVLKVSSFYGFDKKLEELLSQTEFNLRSDNTTGFFVKVVNTNEPVLLTDVMAHIKDLSPRSQRFAKTLGAHSFVAVPLRNEKRDVIGVLAVDYVSEENKMTIADQDLLMTLSEHIGISLHNSEMLTKLADNLALTKRYSDHQEKLRSVFQKFVPTDIAADLAHVDDRNELEKTLRQVNKRSVAIMFSDIFGFSRLSRELPPEDVVDLLNTTFGIMEPVLTMHKGFIDKFTGDGFLAVFEDADCCSQACQAALELIEAMPEVNEALKAKGHPPIQIGLGIHYGPTILGNIGSHDRLNFTVIGDTVNLSARMEAHTRYLGPDTICTSAQVQRAVADEFKWKDLGPITVKSIKECIHAYQLLTHSDKYDSVFEK